MFRDAIHGKLNVIGFGFVLCLAGVTLAQETIVGKMGKWKVELSK